MTTPKAKFAGLALIAALCAGFTSGPTAPAWAGWDEAMAAYQRGDYATAIRELRPLAEQGDASAQSFLGIMYSNGQGVTLVAKTADTESWEKSTGCSWTQPNAGFAPAVKWTGCESTTTVVQAKQQVASIILTAPDGTTVKLPKKLEGSWSSDWDSSWGGSLSIHSQSGSGSSFQGKIEFGNADATCLGEHPFRGSVVEKGQLIITTNLRGACGEVIVKISKDGNKWKGTYKADYPDDGPVVLSPSS